MDQFILAGKYKFEHALHTREHVKWYQAEDLKTQHKVMIKRTKRGDHTMQIDREIAIRRFLDVHQVPCTVPFIEDPIVTERYIYFIFPYFQGQSLYEFIKHVPKNLKVDTRKEEKNYSGVLLQIMLHLSVFLDKLHKLGLMHRHLDLHTVWVNRHSGQVEVHDFAHACVIPGTMGPALELEHLQGFGACLREINGTPGFVDPLLLKRPALYKLEMQDTFSLGMIFLSLAKGSLMETWKRKDLDNFMEHVESWHEVGFFETGDKRLNRLVMELVTPNTDRRKTAHDTRVQLEAMIRNPEVLSIVRQVSR